MNYLIGAFKPSCNISITLSDAKTRKQVPMKKENGQTLMVPLFHSQENIAGKVLCCGSIFFLYLYFRNACLR
ncbi:hypothetical protein OIU84_017024 [Salix udensis]|uniref:Uncharacterized protein n=1 Tax=Salix udensis TaxID=889485 RepID=A0AAD6L2L6_9ROSI|nr:hypothetical protein OIU84_017024 [Salix udensis]